MNLFSAQLLLELFFGLSITTRVKRSSLFFGPDSHREVWESRMFEVLIDSQSPHKYCHPELVEGSLVGSPLALMTDDSMISKSREVF